MALNLQDLLFFIKQLSIEKKDQKNKTYFILNQTVQNNVTLQNNGKKS